MFRKILFPIDFSPTAAKALEFIKKLKKNGAETVVLLNVMDDRHLYFLDEFSSISLDRFDKDMRKTVMREISPFANTLHDAGYKVKVMTARGAPAREILKAEQSEDVSVTVLGSPSEMCFKEMLLGSISETIMKKSRQPVVVVNKHSRL